MPCVLILLASKTRRPSGNEPVGRSSKGSRTIMTTASADLQIRIDINGTAAT